MPDWLGEFTTWHMLLIAVFLVITVGCVRDRDASRQPSAWRKAYSPAKPRALRRRWMSACGRCDGRRPLRHLSWCAGSQLCAAARRVDERTNGMTLMEFQSTNGAASMPGHAT